MWSLAQNKPQSTSNTAKFHKAPAPFVTTTANVKEQVGL